MNIRFTRLTEESTPPRWQIFISPLPSVYYTRELPNLSDGAVVKFASDLAARKHQEIALAYQDLWTFWFNRDGSLDHINPRLADRPNPPYMVADDGDEAFVFQSDLAPDSEWWPSTPDSHRASTSRAKSRPPASLILYLAILPSHEHIFISNWPTFALIFIWCQESSGKVFAKHP